jgi:hypothetical protein
MKILNSTGGPWYKFSDDDKTGYTWEMSKLTEGSGNYVSNNPKVRALCIDTLARHFRLNYYTLDFIYQKLNLKQGELTEDEQKLRQELIDRFDFSNVLKAENERMQVSTATRRSP